MAAGMSDRVALTENQVTQAADLRKLGRGSTVNLAGSLVTAALSLVLPVLVTRGLTQDDAGLFFQVTALFTILISVGTVGADIGVVRAIPQALALKHARDLVHILKIAFLPTLVVGCALASLLAVLVHPISNWVTGGDPAAAQKFAEVFWVLIVMLPISVLYRLGLAVTRALGTVKPLVLIDKIGRSLAEAGAVAVTLSISTSLVRVVIAWVAPYAGASLFVAAWIARRIGVLVPRLDASPEGPQKYVTSSLRTDFWRFSAPSAVSRIFSQALQRFDIILVGALRGPSEAAIYAAATRFPILGLLFVQAIQQVMAPRISEFLVRDDRSRALLMYRTTTSWLVLVSWPIYLLSAWYADLLLGVFGSSYRGGVPVVQILCLVMLVATATGPVDTVLLMSGRSGWSMVNTGTALVVMVSLDVVLIPPYGAVGAAVGWTAAILANNLSPLAQVRYFLGMQPFGRSTLTSITLSVFAFGFVAGVVRIVLGHDLGSFCVAALLATAVFVAGAAHQRRTLELEAMLSSVLRRRRGGDRSVGATEDRP